MHGTRTVEPADARALVRPAARVAPTMAVLVLAVLAANRWGQALLDDGVRLRILAPPLIGRFRLGPAGGVIP